MSWAARRRFLILFCIGAVVVAFLAIVLISTLYKTPTCSDNVQNQGEQGIDCGGPCPYLCTALEQSPVVLFTQVLHVGGRTDLVAEVENKNTSAAAKNVPYTISLYNSKHALIQKVNGTIDLPPGATEPVYIPGIYSGLPAQAGKQKVTSAFLEITSPSLLQWFTPSMGSYVVPVISNITKSGTISNPRVEAIIANPSFTAITGTQVIIFVYDAKKNVIAASRTVIPSLQGQQQAVATFTWNNAFPGTPVVLEVIPIIQLP
jgi:hypothetical protein